MTAFNNNLSYFETAASRVNKKYKKLYNGPIEMKGITRCKLTIIFESAIHKTFLGQIIYVLVSL